MQKCLNSFYYDGIHRVNICYTLTPRQKLAWDHLTNDKNAEVLYGGAKGGGKSFFLCLWVIAYAEKLIDLFQLPMTNNPLLVGFMGRKQSTDFTHTTLETWKRIIAPDMYTIMEKDKEIIIRDRVKIWYGGLDRRESLNKFNSAELAFFAIDQAEETDRTDVDVLSASLRLQINGIKPSYKSLYTANPKECWLKSDFVYGKRKDAVYIPALPSDNPHLPIDYVDTLKKAFAYDEGLLKAYLEGDWEVASSDKVMIPSSTIEKMHNKKIYPISTKRIIACDPASGGDEAVIYVFENTRIIDSRFLFHDDTMRLAGEIMILSHAYGVRDIVLDAIGIGEGIADRLKEMGLIVNPIYSAESASNKTRFLNKRVEMWWIVREMFMNGEIEYPEDSDLREQLSSLTYEIVDSNGKIKLENKANVRSRIGRSPDRADAFIYGIYGLQSVPDNKQRSSGNNLNRVAFNGLGTVHKSNKRLSYV